MPYNEIEPKGIIMKFNIIISRKRRLFQRKTTLEKAIQELENFQKEWNALYEHSERVKNMLQELEDSK
jgi:hypothetical protein